MPAATGYALTTTTDLSFEQAVDRVRTALKDEGFGVLCEFDVQATLREKLGVEQEPYVILGACNPPLAHEALTTPSARRDDTVQPSRAITTSGPSCGGTESRRPR